jgi:hypothetical protein
MPTDNNNDQVSISRTDSGFPAYLDFNVMRTSAINYLGPITASYWTDYNIHDPGITTLEALLYAVLDLGYRVNFPIEDLLTQAPGNPSPDPDFFTPGQLLGGNPFTVVDYRKKLMDLGEVRNAWLEVWKGKENAGAGVTGYLNGIFSIYLELEMDPTDFGTEKEWEAYREKALRQVRRVLQAHRNLCEDFMEPVVLKKKPVTVSADIEIAAGATIAQVYQDLVRTLYAFFSPAPPYYTLGQLVQMGIPLDEVFEGRPYDKWPSHGFILDSDLPDRPTGQTPIYLSAVYNQLQQVTGIRTVRKLVLDTGEPAAAGGKDLAPRWSSQLPDDTLPVFSISGSTFRWYRNGQLLSADLSAYVKSLQQQVVHGGKVLYPAGSADLDGVVPKGMYLQGLQDYYSIQNDYPQVYGIGAGGLPATASVQRQAQALQFKGFLLFFDQLLADYLAQLGNLRTVLSIGGQPGTPGENDDSDPEDTIGRGTDIDPEGAGGGAGSGSTYFAGDVSSVPGLSPLLRFPGTAAGTGVSGSAPPAGGNGSGASSGSGGGPVAGTMLAYPVSAESWNAIAITGTITCNQLGQLAAYTFSSADDRDVAVSELALYFSVLSPTVQYIPVDGKQVIYVIGGIRNDFVLLSQSLFEDAASASKEAATVLFIGGTASNYNLSVLTGEASASGKKEEGETAGSVVYSFSLVQTGASYTNYLQTLLEDPVQYTQRRTAFLDHLMDRFAESFTDYALLSAGFLSGQAIADSQVGWMEKFLGQFPALSADRSKAYDYTKPGWNNTNTSGFEKRFKAYCGIADWRRHYLCNFEVGLAEKQDTITVVLAGVDLMRCPGPFREEEALAAAADLYRQMKSRENYQVIHRGRRYAILVLFYGGCRAESVMDWSEKHEATAAAEHLVRTWQLAPREEDIRVSRYEYRPEITNEGRVVRRSVTAYPEEAAGMEEAGKRIHEINNTEYWQFDAAKDGDPGRLERSRGFEGVYLDVKWLDIPIKHDLPNKPDQCRFLVSDKANTFIFASTGHFTTPSAAREASQALLFDLADTGNYRNQRDEKTGRYRLEIFVEGKPIAREEREYDREEEGRRRIELIAELFIRRIYVLNMNPIPRSWVFDFELGLPGKRTVLFTSSADYDTRAGAKAAAVDFYETNTGWELRKKKQVWVLERLGGSKSAVTCEMTMEGNGAEQEVQQQVAAKSTIAALEGGNKEALNTWIGGDERSAKGGYVYRLVDKDRPRAWHTATDNREATEKARLVLVTRGRRGYVYPEFCLGGDNVHFRQDANGPGSYHFRIRFRNDYFYRIGLPVRDEEWTLFESIAGYATEDAAQQAFQDNYLSILEKAMDRVNYGEKDFIAWDEKGRRRAVVYIPAETREALERAGLNVAGQLMKAAQAYPIRLLDWDRRVVPARSDPHEGDPKGQALPAEDGKAGEDGTGAEDGMVAGGGPGKAAAKYVFVLVNDETGEADWESAGHFANPADAHTAFNYFRLLLNTAGNYFIEYDERDCRYRVGIREVLAESTRAFATAKAAWGPDGVEKFICVAQSAGGFHREKREDGNWGYFVACRNEQAKHPCEYESEQQCDQALDQLYKAAQKFPLEGWVRGSAEVHLLDGETGRPVAKWRAAQRGEESGPSTSPATEAAQGEIDGALLDLILDMQDAVWAGQFFEDTEGLYVPAGAGAVRVRPAESGITRDRWEAVLLQYAAYFPILRNGQGTAGGASAGGVSASGVSAGGPSSSGVSASGPAQSGTGVTYQLEMKLPGFVALPGPWHTDKACGCPPAKHGKEPDCYAAWVSPISYTRATDAWKAYLALQPLLAEKDHYRTLQGEAPGSYTIGLYQKDQIVADSPQTYYYPEMAARALGRAKACINAEGLDLVEHLLLRPEKGTKKTIPVCVPAGGDTILGFQPGADPYSFILTAFLPAWPERFRKQENRQLLESMLQRECPSHILLRILWLTPRDMCRVESRYKDWLRWLTPEKPCGEFLPDDLIELLFHESLACLEDCNVCGDGTGEPTTGASKTAPAATGTLTSTANRATTVTGTPASGAENAMGSDPDEWLSQINLLFCWKDKACADVSGWKPADITIPPAEPAGKATNTNQATNAGKTTNTGKTI